MGVLFDELEADGRDHSPAVTKNFGVWSLTIQRSIVFRKPAPGSTIVIYKDENRFLLIGWGFQVVFKHEMAPLTGILRFEEKEVQEDGLLRPLRQLNGDETRCGTFCIMQTDSPDDGGFPIRVTIPTRTGVAEAEPYFLED